MAGRDPAQPDAKDSPFGVFARKPVERVAASAEARQPESAAAQALRSEAEQDWPEDAVEVAGVLDAYGLKGWVKLVPHAEVGSGGDVLLNARRCWLRKGRDLKTAAVLQAKAHTDMFVAHLAGVADRNAAEALRGYSVFVRRADFPAIASPDEFYWVDLIGMRVVNLADEPLGNVAGLIDNGAHSVLRVEYASTGKEGQPVMAERLIPFVGAYVKTVDQQARRIVVDWETDY